MVDGCVLLLVGDDVVAFVELVFELRGECGVWLHVDEEEECVVFDWFVAGELDCC